MSRKYDHTADYDYSIVNYRYNPAVIICNYSGYNYTSLSRQT
jgi:hypothetical protein